ncbi:MAG: peptidase T [Clostridia bacterium]|nr:peptidase T [Clostridia bacterium]MBQ4085761.1 peptidase T [Clostridia bacterium]
MKAYERLIRYTAFPTASDEASQSWPSTPQQRVFAEALAEEMKELGMTEISVDENGYCFGTIESNIENWNGKTIGFIAHLDVVRDVPFENIKTRLIPNYDGGVVTLESGAQMDPAEYVFLKNYVGETLLVTDGTTLLGADDKAGIANVLTYAEYCKEHPEYKHGRVRVGFTPDEEIGRGALRFDIKAFGADYAYTLDGGFFGEVCYETFNAASAKITVEGVNIHPGSAKGKMINAARIAAEYDSLLPEAERPENTEGYEGFYHLIGMKGETEHAELYYILRDHDAGKLNEKKAKVIEAAEQLNRKYGKELVKAEVADSYRNMKEVLVDHMHLIDNACEAVRKTGREPTMVAARGGTDGCQLSFMGLPCPNLGTGSHNHHGKMEFAIVEEMDKCVEMIRNIVDYYA